MASGRAPAGERRVQIRPLLPDEEVPRGRARDWLSVHNSRYQKGLNDEKSAIIIHEKYRLSNTSVISPAINK